MKHFSRLALLVLCSLLLIGAALGCAANSNDNGNNDTDGSNDGGGDNGGGNGGALSFNVSTNSNGVAAADFDLPAGTNKFGFTAIAQGNNVRIDQLTDQRGNDFVSPGGEMINFASEFLVDSNNLNAPSRASDPTPASGDSYHAEVAVQSSNGGSAKGANVNITITPISDPDFNSGVLHVNIFYVGDIGQAAASKQAIAKALVEFRRIYSTRANISLDVREFDIAGPSVVPLPVEGSDFYRAAAARAPSPAVNLFIVGDAGEGLLGLAGGIPAPPIPTTRSALAVSIVTGSGPDGVFSDEELRLLGETMAHETGHYLGLFHPVDFSGTFVSAQDPLSDTPTCSQKSECEQNSALAANLMFSEPVPNSGGSGFIPQDQLTTQQRAVLNRYVAVD
ncbi:MAG: hypothetical protein U0136_14625 [Bdellovibrionota bacterium]